MELLCQGFEGSSQSSELIGCGAVQAALGFDDGSRRMWILIAVLTVLRLLLSSPGGLGGSPGSECGGGMEKQLLYLSILWNYHPSHGPAEGAGWSSCYLELLPLKGTFYLWHLSMKSEKPSMTSIHSWAELSKAA